MLLKPFLTLLYRLETARNDEYRFKLMNAYLPAEEWNRFEMLLLLTGPPPKRRFSSADLKEACLNYTGMPEWLFNASKIQTGDVAETAALIAGQAFTEPDITSLKTVSDWIADTDGLPLAQLWSTYPQDALVFSHKRLTGRALVPSVLYPAVKLMAQMTGKSETRCLALLLSPVSDPSATFHAFTSESDEAFFIPPFCAYEFSEPETLPEEEEMLLIHIPEGMRVRFGRVGGTAYLASEERVLPESPPEVFPGKFITSLPEGTILEGILQVKDEAGKCPPSKQWKPEMEKKNGWKKLNEKFSLHFFTRDVLYYSGEPLWMRPFSERNRFLEEVLGVAYFSEVGTECRISDAPYGASVCFPLPVRTVLKAVLLYAARTDDSGYHNEFSFALKGSGSELVVIGKAENRLDESEKKNLEHYIRTNTKERFGPMRSLLPKYVFEVGFDSIHPSKRHKTGLVLEGLEMYRLLGDLEEYDADAFEDLRALLQ